MCAYYSFTSTSDNDDEEEDDIRAEVASQKPILQERQAAIANWKALRHFEEAFEEAFEKLINTYTQHNYRWDRINLFNSPVLNIIEQSRDIPEAFNTALAKMLDFFSTALSIEQYQQSISLINCSKILLWLMVQALNPNATETIKINVVVLAEEQFLFNVVHHAAFYLGLRVSNSTSTFKLNKNEIIEFLDKYLSLSLSAEHNNAFVKALAIYKKNHYEDIFQLQNNRSFVINYNFISLCCHEQARNEPNLDKFTSCLDNLLEMARYHFKVELQKVIRHVILERKARNIDKDVDLDVVLCKYTNYYKRRDEIPNDILALVNQADWSNARKYFNNQVSFMTFSGIFLESDKKTVRRHKQRFTQLCRIGEFVLGEKSKLITNDFIYACADEMKKLHFILLKQNLYLLSKLMMPHKTSQDFSEYALLISRDTPAYEIYKQERNYFYLRHGHNRLFLSFDSWEKLKKRDDLAQNAPLRQATKIPAKLLRFFFNSSLNESSSKYLLEHNAPKVI